MNEHRRVNNPYTSRRNHHRPLGEWEKHSIASCSASPNNSIGSQGAFQSRDRQPVGHLSSHHSIVAGTLLGIPATGIGNRCPSSRPYSKNKPQESNVNCKCHAANNSSRCDSLEHTQHGRSIQNQPVNGYPDMEAIQPEAPSHRNIQTQHRQTFSRKALRCRRAVYESARQINSALCGRKKPDTGTRENTPIASPETRYSRKTNPRLHSARHHNSVCSLEYAGRNSNRGLYAASQAPGIHPVPANNRHQDTDGLGSASHSRQLWNTQTSTSREMVKTTSTLSPAFYPDIQLVGKHGRAVVCWNIQKKDSPRFIQECQRAYYND